ncbi:MAG: anhydro-N-acetylmuramic acid kinase [Chitinophagaceae bacterium]|nr:anhydro-N-acetylmuramic acid kinase [Chitinophagaceae bacterium]
MIYRVIGLMSGSSLDGLDIAFIEFEESGGKWHYDIKASGCPAYNYEWSTRLGNAYKLSAYDYLLLHAGYGKYIAEKINEFIEVHDLYHQVQLISSHGHTIFHSPEQGMTAQIGDGSVIAANTGINVVSDLRAVDIAFGGQGAPIVPIGEKLLFGEYSCFLNLGGIANISCNTSNGYVAFDVCSANKILNMLAQTVGKEYDEDGRIAYGGKVNAELLAELDKLDYYQRPHPKSLDNSFGTTTVYPIIQSYGLHVEDAMCTYVEHIADQICNSFQSILESTDNKKLLVTGGGAFNKFLTKRLQTKLLRYGVEVVIPDADLVNNKEALIMALIGILRWREEYNVLSSGTGASRDSINGAVWIGQEA